MPRSRLPHLLLLAFLLCSALLVSLTYTGPIFERDRRGPVERLLRETLGDPARLPARWVAAAPLPFDSAVAGTPPPAPPPPSPTPAEHWAHSAVQADSAAVRGWLGAAVLELAGHAGAHVRITLYRLTLHPGCPLLSRLHAELSGDAGDLRVDRIESSCPRLPPAALPPGTS